MTKFLVIAIISVVASFVLTTAHGKQKATISAADFEQLRNLSQTSVQKILNCSSVFTIQESIKYLNICVAESSARRRREIYSIESFDDEEGFGLEIDSDENLEGISEETLRVKRSKKSRNNKHSKLSWKWLEARNMKQFPCIGLCILRKLNLFNSTDEPDRVQILMKIQRNAINITQAKAEEIADGCIQKYTKMATRVPVPTTGYIQNNQRCKAAVKLGICVSKDTFNYCKANIGIKVFEGAVSINSEDNIQI